MGIVRLHILEAPPQKTIKQAMTASLFSVNVPDERGKQKKSTKDTSSTFLCVFNLFFSIVVCSLFSCWSTVY